MKIFRAAALLVLLALLPGCAQVWVSPTGLDSNPGTASAPKRSFAAACQVAAKDGRRFVHVKAGTFTSQVVPSSCSASPGTLFKGEGGQALVKNETAGPNGTATLEQRAQNVGFLNIDVDSAFQQRQGLGTHGATLFQDGKIGNVTDEKGSLSGSSGPVRFLRTDFHDVRITSSDVHNECLYSQTPGLEVINSTFRACSTMDILVTRRCFGDEPWQPIYGGGKLIGNTFGHSVQSLNQANWHYAQLVLHGCNEPSPNWEIRNNLIETQQNGTPGTGGITWGSWTGGKRCGNRETPGVNHLGAEWKVPC